MVVLVLKINSVAQNPEKFKQQIKFIFNKRTYIY